MDLHLKDKVIIVTGGAKGIGAAITRGFAREGAIPIILGRNPGEAESIIAELHSHGQRADAIVVEMTSEDEVRQAVEHVLSAHGRIDVVINNAGTNDAVNLRSSPTDFKRSLDRNVVHYYTLVHYALDALIESRGSIVNISSKTATTGQGGTSGYAASKGAINALTREWALDLANFGIRVNCVAPAEVMTPLYEGWLKKFPNPEQAKIQLNNTIPLGQRTTTLEEIADAVVFVASERSSHTTGQIIYPDGGYTHLDRAFTAETSHLKTTP